MELAGSFIQIFITFFDILRNETLQHKLKKKIHLEKIFHFLGKWNFLTLILKSVLYFKDASLANNFIRNKIRNLNAVNGRRVLYKTVTNETF